MAKISQLHHEILMLTAKKGEHWLSNREGAYMQAHRELIAAGYIVREGDRHRLTKKGNNYVNVFINQQSGIEPDNNIRNQDNRTRAMKRNILQKRKAVRAINENKAKMGNISQEASESTTDDEFL